MVEMNWGATTTSVPDVRTVPCRARHASDAVCRLAWSFRSETGAGDDGPVQVGSRHGPVVGRIAVGEDGACRRSHPVAAAAGVGEDGGRRIEATDHAGGTAPPA